MVLNVFTVFGDAFLSSKGGKLPAGFTEPSLETRRRGAPREFPVSSEPEFHPELRPELLGVPSTLPYPLHVSVMSKESAVPVFDQLETVLSVRGPSAQGGMGGCCCCCLSR